MIVSTISRDFAIYQTIGDMPGSAMTDISIKKFRVNGVSWILVTGNEYVVEGGNVVAIQHV